MNTYQEKLAALGDPTRHAIFEQLRTGPSAVGEIARSLPVSRPAVSQHLRVLERAGLVLHHAEGTRRIYRLDPDGIVGLHRHLEEFWTAALQGLKERVERAAGQPEGAADDG